MGPKTSAAKASAAPSTNAGKKASAAPSTNTNAGKKASVKQQEPSPAPSTSAPTDSAAPTNEQRAAKSPSRASPVAIRLSPAATPLQLAPGSPSASPPRSPRLSPAAAAVPLSTKSPTASRSGSPKAVTLSPALSPIEDDADSVRHQIQVVARLLAAAFERKVGGSAPEELAHSRRVAGITLPPIGRSSGRAGSTEPITEPPPSGIAVDGRLLCTEVDCVVNRPVLPLSFSGLEAEPPNACSNQTLPPPHTTGLQDRERRLTDARAALSILYHRGDVSSELRVVEVQLAECEAELRLAEPAYDAVRRRYEAARDQQQRVAEISVAHSHAMLEARQQHRLLEQQLREQEKEISLNHAAMEDLIHALSERQQRQHPAEAAALQRIHRTRAANATMEDEYRRVERDSKQLLECRRRELEALNREIALFDPKLFAGSDVAALVTPPAPGIEHASSAGSAAQQTRRSSTTSVRSNRQSPYSSRAVSPQQRDLARSLPTVTAAPPWKRANTPTSRSRKQLALAQFLAGGV